MSSRALLAAIAGTVLVAGCSTSQHHHDDTMASAVTIENQWASSAQTGMAAVFGTLSNAGHHDAVVVSGRSPVAARVEVHEVVPDAPGTTTMRRKDGA